jgi:hypothetical protein
MDNGQWTMDNGQLKRHAECPDSSAADRRDVSRRGEQGTRDNGQWTIDNGQLTVQLLNDSRAFL